MFENLKKKLKGFFGKTKEELEVKEEPKVEEKIEKPKPKPKPEPKPEKPKAEKIVEKPPEEIPPPIPKPEEITPPPTPQPPTPEIKPEEAVEKPKKKFRLFSRLTKKELSDKDLDSILWELELALVENDVAKEVTESICADTKKALLGAEAERKSVEEVVKSAIRESIQNILNQEKVDLLKLVKSKQEKPFVILFFGFNGSGKTLTIGKFAKLLKDKGHSVVFAAGDTFRAAAIEQLEVHAKNLGVPVIKQKRGSDSAAVIYDAIAHAKSKGIDVVLGDTAGRSHTNTNLMDELEKVVRVNKPDLKIFVGDALTGNDAASQAREFNNSVGIDASVLNKVDCDAKGGACLSVSYVTGKPIIYLGTGQDYADMQEFDPEWFLSKIF